MVVATGIETVTPYRVKAVLSNGDLFKSTIYARRSHA